MDERHGFIHDKLDIKILILYVMRRLPRAIERAALTDIISQCDTGIGYFDFSDCLSELVSSGHLLEDDEDYSVTDKGRLHGADVESDLPYSVRKRADKLIKPEAERLARLSMLTFEHRVENGSTILTLAMRDGKGEMLHLDILVSGVEQAKRIEKAFRKNAEGCYADIIALLDK